MFGRGSAASGEAIANAGSRRRKLTTEDTERTERKKRFGMVFLDRMTDSKRSEERLPKAAQRVSVANQFKGFTGRL
jgi:hypothetical protein